MFRFVLSPENFDQLEMLRFKPSARDEVAIHAPDQRTSVDMKLNANLFAEMINRLGYPKES